MPQRLLLFFLMILAAAMAPREVAASDAAVTVRTGEHAGYSRVVFDWDAPVAAEIRSDKGKLVVIFSRPATFDLRKAHTRKLKRIGGIAPAKDGVSVVVALRGKATYKLMNYDNTVVIDVMSGSAANAKAESAKTVKKKETIMVAAAIAELGLDGLAFQSAGGPVSTATTESVATAAATAPSVPEIVGPLPSPLFDIASWRGGEDFLKAYRAAAELTDSESPEELIKLARLQFAWRHGEEGLTMLERAIEKEPALAKRGDIAALREALALQAGRPDNRTNAFLSPLFDKTPEGLLWRGVADAADRRWNKAAQSFAIGLKALEAYPEELRTDLALVAAQTGLEVGDVRLTGTALELAEPALADPTARAEWNALKGLLLMQDHDFEAAEPFLLAAAAGDALRPRIQAQLGLIDLGRASGRLNPADVAIELEGLSYVWQGDDLQLQILDRLIDAQASLGRHGLALEAADAAVVAAANAAAQRRYRDRMAELLEAALDTSNSGGADKIGAIALFHRYGEMLSDETKRVDLGLKLADQLAAADLSPQALDVLRELKRTAPDVRQSAIAARLAVFATANGTGVPHQDVEPVPTIPSSETATAAARIADPDKLWRGKRWSEAANSYLDAIAQSDGSNIEGRPRLILRAAASLLLAGRNHELAGLRQSHGDEMKVTSYGELFNRLTAPDADYSLLIAPEMARALTVSQ